MIQEPGIPSQRMVETRVCPAESRSNHRKEQVKQFANTYDARHDFPTDNSESYLPGREEPIRGIGYAYKCQKLGTD